MARGPEATEAVSWKIQRLLQGGVNREEIAAGVRLLGECSWATTTTEQMHASVTLIHRHHPSYELNALLVRSGLHTIRRLVPGSSQEEKLMERLNKTMNKLDSRQPNKVTGRVAMFRDIVKTLKDTARSEGQTLSAATIRKVCRIHGRAWEQLSYERQEEYEAEARALAETRADALQATIQETAIRLSHVRAQHEANLAANPFKPLLFSCCTLTEEAIAEWQTEYESLKDRPSHLKHLRKAALDAPELPGDDEVEEMDELPVGDAENPLGQKTKLVLALCAKCEMSCVPVAL